MTTANGRTTSDAIAGAMCWCPITSLDYANASYEWNLGQFSSTGTRAPGTWTRAYSQDLATAFVTYQNHLKLRDTAGRKLALDRSSTGTYLSGRYYDHLVSVITGSLNDAKATGWNSSYGASAYDTDFATRDTIGKDLAHRTDTYNPMYYLNSYYDGYKTATVAPRWRIRTGIMQGDTANTTELNLALALANHGTAHVDFATVWGQGHTMAERTGNPTTNFITWVNHTVAR